MMPVNVAYGATAKASCTPWPTSHASLSLRSRTVACVKRLLAQITRSCPHLARSKRERGMAIQFAESLHPCAFSQVVSQVKRGENFFLVVLLALRVPSGHATPLASSHAHFELQARCSQLPSSRIF